MDIPSSSSSTRDSLSSRQENIKRLRIDSPTTRSQESDLGISKLSDSVLLVYDPAVPHVDVVFFHGLQYEHTGGLDVHLSTWTCKHDSKTIWPQLWLQEQRARVFFIKYDASLQKTDSTGRLDLTIIAENLLTELGWAFHIGQESSSAFRPIILVGHCFGGLVIKQLCIHAAEREVTASRVRLEERLLKSIKGILFCGTPHLGSEMLAGTAKEIMSRSPLLPFVELLSTEVVRQGETFRTLSSKENWEIFSLGEAYATEMKTNWFRMVVGGISRKTIVKEASARWGPNYITVHADHLSLCKPESKESNMFQYLVQLIERVNKPQVQCHARRRKRVPDNPVCTESLLETVTAEIGQGRPFIGFAGMGGVGKTTLAKLLYNVINSRFEYACFVEVKQITGDKRKVKEEVWKHISPQPEGEYSESRWDEMTKKKLLIIFDDVEKREDVELLEEIAQENGDEGSCFVVTSRDEGLFHLFGNKIYVCRVPVLASEHARQLFITHAFPGKKEPPSALGEIVVEIVARCDGLPLTLEVIGRLLRGKTDKRMWEEIPKALQVVDSRRLNSLEEQVWGKLRVSIDNLGTEELEMFLDVATIFTRPGEYKYFGMRHNRSEFTSEEVMTAWSSMYGYAHMRWQVLKDRSLVYSGEMDNQKDKFEPRMHEHLRTLGIRVALEKGRIIEHNPLDGNYKGTPGLEKVIFHQILVEDEYMEYDEDCCDERRPCKLRITSNFISWLKGLRYLVFQFNCFQEPCKRCAQRPLQLPPKLTMLHWDTARTIFVRSTLNELVVLHVASGVAGMKQLNPDSSPEFFGQRLHLNESAIVGCGWLSWWASFGNLANLEQLVLSRCEKLQSLPESFGRLLSLKGLRIDGCVELQALHISFGNFTNLKQLVLSSCKKLQSLPESFGRLLCLERLRINDCSELQALPGSFGNLANLEDLDLSGCEKLQSLPGSFCQLLCLKKLDISGCSELQALPGSFGNLANLEELHFQWCKKLESLPESFGRLLRLDRLIMYNCSELQALPGSFGNLANLKELSLSGCKKLQSLPESFGRLLRLDRLRLYYCSDLQALPRSFGNLVNLEELDLSGCERLQSLPESFCQLLCLKKLDIGGCSELQALPGSFGNLANLKELRFYGCGKLHPLPESLNHSGNSSHEGTWTSNLQALPISFGNLSGVEELFFSGDLPDWLFL